jgi:hypothetical protein
MNTVLLLRVSDISISADQVANMCIAEKRRPINGAFGMKENLGPPFAPLPQPKYSREARTHPLGFKQPTNTLNQPRTLRKFPSRGLRASPATIPESPILSQNLDESHDELSPLNNTSSVVKSVTIAVQYSPNPRLEPLNQPKTWSQEPLNQSRAWSQEPLSQSRAWSQEPLNQPKTWPQEPINQLKTWPQEPLNQPKTWSQEPLSQPKTWSQEPLSQPKAWPQEPPRETRCHEISGMASLSLAGKKCALNTNGIGKHSAKCFLNLVKAMKRADGAIALDFLRVQNSSDDLEAIEEMNLERLLWISTLLNNKALKGLWSPSQDEARINYDKMDILDLDGDIGMFSDTDYSPKSDPSNMSKR